MPANREQIEQLVAAAPNFRNRWEGDEVPPWFVGMSELAHYVVESFAKGVTVPTIARTAKPSPLGRS